MLLTVAVDAAVALLQCDEAPGNVVVEHYMTEVVEVDTLTAAVAADEDTYLTVLLGKVAHHIFLLGVGERTVKAFHLVAAELELTHDSLLQILHGGYTLGEDDDALLLILLPNLLQFQLEGIVTGVLVVINKMPYVCRETCKVAALVLLLTFFECEQGSNGRGEKTLEHGKGKQRVVGIAVVQVAEPCVLHTEDILFLGSKMYVDRYDIALLKLAADAGVRNVVLEAAYIIRHHIFLGVFPTAWNGDGFQHTHQVGKRLSRPVVWGGGS